MRYEKAQRIKQRELYPGAPKGQFKQFRHGLSSFIECLRDDLVAKGVNIKYQTAVKDITASQKNMKLKQSMRSASMIVS